MYEVLDRLYIGGNWDANDSELLREKRIVAVLTCAWEADATVPSDITHLKIPLRDGSSIDREELDTMLEFISSHIKGGNVLVHCSKGRSRSPSVVIAYLVSIGMHLDSSINVVEMAVPWHIGPSNESLDSIKEYFDNLDKW